MHRLVKVVVCAWALSGCAAKGAEPPPDLGLSETRPSWEAFRAEAYEDETGMLIYDGDLTAPDEASLRALYDELFPHDGALIVQHYGGRDRVWSSGEAHQLTYCVSDTFGARHAEVVQAMEQAADDWMAAADVSFQHVAEEDGSCTASNPRVLFDVRPTSTSSYLARAFFPGYSRGRRNVLVSGTAFSSYTPLAGILRHELGHVLGFLHEHIRRPGTTCSEGGSYREVTDYDPGSVMHYPQCGGTNYRYDLSASDIAGAREIYGSPVSEMPTPTPEPTPEPEPEPTPAPSGSPRTGTASSTVARGAQVAFQPIAIVGGTAFTVDMTGTGDADLYVRFDAAPTTSAYDCRPYAADANERCDLTAPAAASQAYVMVRGYTEASFRIEATWRAP